VYSVLGSGQLLISGFGNALSARAVFGAIKDGSWRELTTLVASPSLRGRKVERIPTLRRIPLARTSLSRDAVWSAGALMTLEEAIADVHAQLGDLRAT
jgi:hypothetical protein